VLDDAVVMVLAGGVGERLYPLTRERAKPAVYFGGPYRIIDFTLSNCLNSGLRRIFIALQYKSLSLTRHLRFGWNVMSEELGEFVEVLHPQKRIGEHWYLGTADAVYQNFYSIQRETPRQLIVLSGDHVYKMDYGRMLRFHKERGAGATIAVIEVSSADAHRFGVMQVDDDDRLTGFLEKPRDLPPGQQVLASMGIYIFDLDVLTPALEEDARSDTSHDFGKDIIPSLIDQVPVYAYRFYDENKKAAKYWRDIGTLDAYYDANMDVVSVSPIFNLYDRKWPLRTRQRQYPPAKFVFGEPGRTGMAVNSIVSQGCIVSGAVVRNSVISQDVRVNSYAEIDSSIIFTHVDIGRHCRIKRAIIDRDVHLPEGTVIGYDQAEDKRHYHVTPSGLTVVTRDHSLYESPVDSDYLNGPR